MITSNHRRKKEMAEAGQEIVDEMVTEFEKTQAGGESALPAPETVPGDEGETGSEPASELESSEETAPSLPQSTEAEPTEPEPLAEGDLEANLDALLSNKDLMAKYPQLEKQLSGQRKVFTQYTQKASELERQLELATDSAQKSKAVYEELLADMNPREPGEQGAKFLEDSAIWAKLEEDATEDPAEIERIRQRIEVGEETDEYAVERYKERVQWNKEKLDNMKLNERVVALEGREAEREKQDAQRKLMEDYYKAEQGFFAEAKKAGLIAEEAENACDKYYGRLNRGLTPDRAKIIQEFKGTVKSKPKGQDAEAAANLVRAASANAARATRPSVGTQPAKGEPKFDLSTSKGVAEMVDHVISQGKV